MTNVLITGTSTGIGLAASVELARRGARVFASMRDLSRSQGLRDAAAAAGVGVEIVQLDVTDPSSVQRAVNEVLQACGRIDVVVNNAGIVAIGALELFSEQEVSSVFETNVFGPLRVARAVLPSMRERGEGRIVNVSSASAHARLGHRAMGLYATSKAALSALSAELCKDVAQFGIKVVLTEAVGGTTAMSAAVATGIEQGQGQASPYGLDLRVLAANDFGPDWDGVESVGMSARLIADACLMADPPFYHPPEAAGFFQVLDGMADATFRRLCAFDPTPELYEGLTPFWQASRKIAEEEQARR